MKSYFFSLTTVLSTINKENIIWITDSIKTILAMYANEVNCIETPNIIGNNIFKILSNIALIEI